MSLVLVDFQHRKIFVQERLVGTGFQADKGMTAAQVVWLVSVPAVSDIASSLSFGRGKGDSEFYFGCAVAPVAPREKAAPVEVGNVSNTSGGQGQG